MLFVLILFCSLYLSFSYLVVCTTLHSFLLTGTLVPVLSYIYIHRHDSPKAKIGVLCVLAGESRSVNSLESEDVVYYVRS